MDEQDMRIRDQVRTISTDKQEENDDITGDIGQSAYLHRLYL